ncbi:MAG: SMI1/KNR4 family protein, partial [Hyphomonas sp.]
MGVSTLSGALRIGLGVSLVLFALAAGLLQRAPWILPFLGAGFTAAYLFGQLRTWRHARNAGRLRLYWLQLPADFGVQLVLVTVLYLVGFGLSAIVSGDVRIAPFAPGDAIWPLAVGAVASLLGVYIDRIEGKPSTYFPAWMTGNSDSAGNAREDIRLLPEKVTLQSFFTAPADTVSANEHEAAAWADAYSTLTEGLSEDDITRAEARLGRALPDLLIALYRQQNGGAVARVCVP